MNDSLQKRTIRAHITFSMELPAEWSDADIWFYLNESSWCASNVLPILEKMDEEHGCLCNYCEFEVINEDEQEVEQP